MNILISGLLLFFGLGIMATVHELGHYFAARRLGVRVEEVSIFVGPSLFSWERKGVRFHIRLIPFGAYVLFPGMIEDEEGYDETDPDMYFNQPRWKRLLIKLAGPLTNILLGILIFFVMFLAFDFLTAHVARADDIEPELVGTQIENTPIEDMDRIIAVNGKRAYTGFEAQFIMGVSDPAAPMTLTLRSDRDNNLYEAVLIPQKQEGYRLGVTVKPVEYNEAKAWEVLENDPKQNLGKPVLQEGDLILAVNDVAVDDPDYSKLMAAAKDEQVTVLLIRDSQKIEVMVYTLFYEAYNDLGIKYYGSDGLWTTTREALLFPISVLRVTILGLGEIIAGRIAPTEAIAGPLGIATIISEVVDDPGYNVQQKVFQLTFFAGYISVALAITNMMPLPGLDGNDIVLTLIELIRGKKLSLRTEKVIATIGFILIIMLVGFALYSDIIRILGR